RAIWPRLLWVCASLPPVGRGRGGGRRDGRRRVRTCSPASQAEPPLTTQLPRTLSLALRFSLREMRGGLSGFAIFLTCIALGGGGIGGVNSVARATGEGVANQGQSLLGGDLRFEVVQREATDAERSFLAGLGRLSQAISTRSMARLADGSDQALVELKAVDQAYPLYGALETTPAEPLAGLLAERSGVFG